MASSGEEEKRSIPAMSTTATGPKTHETSTKIPPSIKDKELDFLIMVSVRCGHVRVLNRINRELPNYSFSFQHTSYETDNNQFTPLLYACKYNQKEVLEWLLPKVKKHDKTRDRETALILAVRHEEVNLELIRSLLKDGDQNLGDKDKHKMTALHIACSKGCMDVVKLLLDYNNAWSAQGDKVAPKILGRKELRNKDGNTPFMLAVSERHQEIVKMWLKMEQEPSMILRPVCEDVNKKKFNAVMIAARSGQLKCLEIMEESNAITDDICKTTTMSEWNIIHCAIASGCLETLKWLITKKAIVLKTTEIFDAPNKKGYTPFLLACEYHHCEVVKYLIDLAEEGEIEININAKTEKGMTGLHLAAMHDAKEIVDLLLDYEFDIFAQENEHGDTALHVATRKSSLRVENRLQKEPEYEKLKCVKNNDEETAEDVRKPVHIPLEIRKRGEKSIDAYLKALREGKTKNNHCNLIVLGEERVGKTSLIKSVLGKEFDPHCKSTQGVELDDIETVAELVDIEMSDVESRNSEIWKAAVSPQKRASEQITDSVAKAINEADPKHSKATVERKKEHVSEGDLLRNVNQIIKRLKPLEQRKPILMKKKKPPQPPQATKLDDHSPTPPALPTQQKWDKPPPMHQPLKQITSHPVYPPKPPAPLQMPIEENDHPSEIPVNTVFQKAPRVRESISYQDSTAIAKKLKHKKNDQENVIFHAVDFAGQSLYRLMHHCFITHRAIYILVFKLTDVLKHICQALPDKDPISEIRYWLNNIIAHASVGNKKEVDPPKIFLVGTHRNGENGIAISEKDLKAVNQHLLKVFVKDIEEKRYERSIQMCQDKGGEVVFAIENSMTEQQRLESGINHLMSRIRAASKEMPFIKEDFPISYMRFEKKIFEMREERRNEPLATSRKQVELWARECGLSDDEGINTAIQFFHDIRVIIDQTLISSPFKQRKSSLNDPIVLLSPQWLGEVMRMIVELEIGGKGLSIEGSKSLENYGIIHKEDLLHYLSSEIKSLVPEQNFHASLLEVLELYCLIYPLNKLHCRLLGYDLRGKDFREEDNWFVEGSYLIPVKLPRKHKDSKELSLFGEYYIFEFDFQSYLPEEVYLYTICYFLSLMTDLKGDLKLKYVTLTKSCSKFMYVCLGNLPKAHWKIEMSEITRTLVFSVKPFERVENPCQFVVQVAEHILQTVCINSTLGYLEYRGGPRAKCQNDDEVLLPVVTSDVYMGFQTAENGKVICPNCESEKKDANIELSKMIQGELLGSNNDHTTVFAAAAPDKVTRMICELDTALSTLVKWEKFATHLRNIEHHYIEKIKRDNEGVDQQKRALYGKWLSLCPDASWSDVATALDISEEKTLAEKVRKDHSL